MSKTVRVIKDYDHWVSSQIHLAYKAGNILRVPEAHAIAGEEAGAFEVLKDAKEAKPVGYKPGA